MNKQKGIIKALLVAAATAFLSASAVAASVDLYVATVVDGFVYDSWDSINGIVQYFYELED